ncbi:hypothetical protein [Echinococcus multilocularis]|uniref:Uncharacterized protein n=1 Tax=Echinococcus multilocularis TaxID=6211 RepID=A0A068Y102_ECHMU|nr:hypothetical protein [Echinococcus multilocularis]
MKSCPDSFYRIMNMSHSCAATLSDTKLSSPTSYMNQISPISFLAFLNASSQTGVDINVGHQNASLRSSFFVVFSNPVTAVSSMCALFHKRRVNLVVVASLMCQVAGQRGCIYQALTRRLHQTTFFDRFLRRMRSVGYNKIINAALAGLSSDVRILLDVAEEALLPDFMRNASASSRDPSSLLGRIHTSYLLSCLRTQHCLDTVANLRQVLHFRSLFVLQPTQPPSLEHETSAERPTPDTVHSDIVVLIFRFHGDASYLNVVRRKLART